jgi:peptidoglycan/xylan/chitin deacetylase (PgdA/CDA1 family)
MSRAMRDALVSPTAAPGQAARLKTLARRGIAATAAVLGSLIRVSTTEPVIALTFDDGPHPVDTPALLEVLARHRARATFFLVGKPAARHPELVARIVAEGHAVGGHTWDHPSLPTLAGRYRRRQLDWTRQALGAADSRLFRPPFGHQSLRSRLDARRRGLTVVCWDVVAEDWRDDPADQLVERVYRTVRRGSIVLFHDTLYSTTDERFRDRGATRAAVDRLLTDLSAQYRVVTVPQLLRHGRPVRWHWYRRPSLERLRESL